MRPGTNVTTSTALPTATPAVDTGRWFVAGVTSQGPTGAQLVENFQQFIQIYGNRGSVPILWDSIDTFFKEGGSSAYIARVVGPAATGANVAIPDSGAQPSLLVKAIGPGAYANGYQIVVAGTAGNYTITVEDSSGNILEQSPTLTSNQDAVGYGQNSSTVIVVSKGANSPGPGTYTLAGGVDDTTNVGDTQYVNALAAFTADLGPGQVSVPGQTDQAVITGLFNHASTFNRVALADLADLNGLSSSAAANSWKAAIAPITALGTVARSGGCFAPWADVEPLPGSLALRAVPPSAFVAAKCAQVDAGGNPNEPAAGDNGICGTIVQLHNTIADVDRQVANAAGVNLFKKFNGGVYKVYGFRTSVNATGDPNYFQLNNARLDMAIIADAQVIQERYVFSQIDGQGMDATRYGNELTGMLLGYYISGALYGASAQDAFTVDSSPDVNTPALEATATLTATIACRRSPEAEQVNLNIVRVPITQAV